MTKRIPSVKSWVVFLSSGSLLVGLGELHYFCLFIPSWHRGTAVPLWTLRHPLPQGLNFVHAGGLNASVVFSPHLPFLHRLHLLEVAEAMTIWLCYKVCSMNGCCGAKLYTAFFPTWQLSCYVYIWKKGDDAAPRPGRALAAWRVAIASRVSSHWQRDMPRHHGGRGVSSSTAHTI